MRMLKTVTVCWRYFSELLGVFLAVPWPYWDFWTLFTHSLAIPFIQIQESVPRALKYNWEDQLMFEQERAVSVAPSMVLSTSWVPFLLFLVLILLIYSSGNCTTGSRCNSLVGQAHPSEGTICQKLNINHSWGEMGGKPHPLPLTGHQ